MSRQTPQDLKGLLAFQKVRARTKTSESVNYDVTKGFIIHLPRQISAEISGCWVTPRTCGCDTGPWNVCLAVLDPVKQLKRWPSSQRFSCLLTLCPVHSLAKVEVLPCDWQVPCFNVQEKKKNSSTRLKHLSSPAWQPYMYALFPSYLHRHLMTLFMKSDSAMSIAGLTSTCKRKQQQQQNTQLRRGLWLFSTHLRRNLRLPVSLLTKRLLEWTGPFLQGRHFRPQ